MSEEFKKIGVNTVTSENGFTVQVRPMGGVLYRDANGEFKIDSEWLVKPPRILLYKSKRSIDKMEQAIFDNMFINVTRALEFLGHQVEIWS